MGNANLNHDTNLIRAAGGLVWRDSSQGKVLGVVHRKRYDDWTLPKGKLKEDESWLDAARREVKEETGCQVRVGSFAGSIGYNVDGEPKIVRFWNMAAVAKPSKKHDLEEVEKVVWLVARPAQGQGATGRDTGRQNRAFIGSERF